MKIRETFDGIEKISHACDDIKQAGACDKCPLQSFHCLESITFLEFADSVTKGDIEEMVAFSQNIDHYYDERDFEQYIQEEQLLSEMARWDRERL